MDEQRLDALAVLLVQVEDNDEAGNTSDAALLHELVTYGVYGDLMTDLYG